MKLSKSHTIVRKHVEDYCSEVQEKVKQEIKEKIDRGEKFSLTTDEWTSIGGRRFMNINIHGQKTFVRNLGLIRITGSFTSEAALSTMEKHLQN